MRDPRGPKKALKIDELNPQATVQKANAVCTLCIVLPSVAQDGVRVLTAEKHDRAARAVEGQCVSAARTRTDVLYLSPVYAIETPAITELSDKGPTTEQHNRAGSGCHGRARARGRSERRYLNPARAIPRPGRNALTIEQEHSGAYAVKGHWTGSRRSGVCLLGPILAVELPGIRDGRRLVCPKASK